MVQEVAHVATAEQLRGVPGHVAGRQELQARHLAFDQDLAETSRPHQDLREPWGTRGADRTWRAQVSSDQDDPMTGQSQDPRQTRSRRRGPLPRTSRGDDHDLPSPVRQGMEHVGASGPKPLLNLCLRTTPQPQRRRILRQHTEHGRRQGLAHVLRSPEALVEQLLDENPHVTQNQSGQQPHAHAGDQGGGPSGTHQLGGGQQGDLHRRVTALQLGHFFGRLADDLIGQNLSLTRSGCLHGDLHRHGLGRPCRRHRGGQLFRGDIQLEGLDHALGDRLRGEDRNGGVGLQVGELGRVVLGLCVQPRVSAHLHVQVRLSCRRVGTRRHESEHY